MVAENRNQILEDKMFAPIADTFIYYLKNLDYSSCVLEFSNNYYYKSHTYSESFFIQSFLDLCRFKAKFMSNLRKKKFILFLEKYDEFLKILQKNGYQCSKFEKKRIFYLGILLVVRANFFEKILKQIQPKVCFELCYYNPENFALTLACHRLKIPTVDIQHGLQGNLHFAYNNWLNQPAEGYSVIPTFFWVWSNFEQKIIENWTTKKNQQVVFVGGDLWLNAWVSKKENLRILFEKEFNFPLLLNENYIKILITLQTSEIFKDLEEIIKQSEDNFYFFIRLHPRMKNQIESYKMKFVEYKNINIQQASSLPLHLLLRNMDIHITNSSSTVIEAFKFGIKSISTNPESNNIFPLEYEKGGLLILDSIPNIIDTIKRSKRGSSMVKQKENKSVEKINYFITEILNI